MRPFLIALSSILTLSFTLSCSLFEKEDNKKEDALTALLLYVYAYNQAAGCSGPKSGFTICIPKGIAE
ncbi:hypothetical protein [Leptospira jelokensis]|uniref:Lipoprotein n=1 Tax=Leptospira jelokensis TaxID=2484931 RepID=A0A4Z0ZTT9_9LEPT|nr:hypothetical protein [Leptospira jelokensis]TGL69838.1 hypothetical protein EHQ62_07530 [Leptospira jelokensis]TGM01194.1 hypothetical protein EHQ79_06985 [Leptospira jelokensis]